jgi:hypothetical protein
VSQPRRKSRKTWSTNYPNENGASISFIDFFYNDCLVFRKKYATVDGGNCMLPLPDRKTNGEFSVSNEYSAIIEVLNQIQGNNNYDYFFKRSGIALIEKSILV